MSTGTAVHRRSRLRRLQPALTAVGVLCCAILLALLVDRTFLRSPP